MKRLLNLKFIILFFILNFFVLSINNVFAEDVDISDISKCQNSCPPGKSCAILPKCKTGCSTGCQPGYYLSDGDGDHTNNCKTSGGFCTELSLKGICEICPPGFFCPGGMIDKIPCPPGKYIDKMGKTKIGDCDNPAVGFCVAKAKLIGPQTATIPSVCLQQSNDVSSNTVRGVSEEKETDISGAINSGFPNDKGINGYTESNTLGANISIPCPVGTYSTSENGASFCSVPDKGYCTSYNGIDCVISNNEGGGGMIKVGSDLNLAIINAVGAAGVSGLGATKQAPCPVGTYDMRTAYGRDYTKPAPFCVYPDIGHSTASSSTGSYSQTICAEGSYDSRGGFNDSANSSCSLCSPGYYTKTEGQAACSFCSSGKYSNKGKDIYGSTDCINCSAGKYQTNSGMSYCDSCGPNTYSGTNGAAFCDPCGPETWSDGGASYCPACEYNGWTNSICQEHSKWYATRTIKTGKGNSIQCSQTVKYDNGDCSYCSSKSTTMSETRVNGCTVANAASVSQSGTFWCDSKNNKGSISWGTCIATSCSGSVAEHSSVSIGYGRLKADCDISGDLSGGPGSCGCYPLDDNNKNYYLRGGKCYFDVNKSGAHVAAGSCENNIYAYAGVSESTHVCEFVNYSACVVSKHCRYRCYEK